MRVLHLVQHVINCGNGVVNALIDLAYAQSKSGLDVAIASVGGNYEAFLAQNQIQHFYLNQSLTSLNLIKAPLRFNKILSDFQPDIVHIHITRGIIMACLFQIFHKYKNVSTVQCEFMKSSILMGFADRVIAVSDEVGNSMIHRGVAAAKVRIVLNGTIGSPRIRPANEYIPIELKHPNISTVCGMFFRKGVAELIEAFLQIAGDFPDLHLYLIGHGDDRSFFQSLAKNSPFYERIHFEGFQSEPQRYLLSTDIFVLASHKDPAPLVIPEARALGCAIVATNVDGIPELLDQGNAGILVPPKNSDALAKELKSLLTNPEQIQLWKTRAKSNLEQFNIHRVNQEVLEVYNELLN